MAKHDPHLKRRRALSRKFRNAGIDGLLVSGTENVRYLSGFRGEDSVLLVTRDAAALVTDGRYVEQAGSETTGLEILVRKKALMPAAARQARRMEIGRLGVEAGAVTLAQYESLREAAKSIALVSTAGLVERLRLLKDRDEVRAIERAVAVAEEAFLAVIGRLRPGMTEREVALSLDRTMTELGAEAPAFPTIVAAGKNSSRPHAVPTDRRIRRGDALLVDWGARVDGYHSDLTRMLFLARIPPIFRRMFPLVQGAQRRALTQMRPGRPLKQPDASARAHFKAHRHNRYFTHGLGHGLGLMIHEAPALASGNDQTLKPGMVCTVEPGLYRPGRGGVRIEDDVLITRNGHRVLTTLPKSLESFLLSP